MQNAKYYRDALVLDKAKLLLQQPQFLERFFDNLLLDGQHDLSFEKMYEKLGII